MAIISIEPKGSFFVIICRSRGPAGPAGSAGPAGPAGPGTGDQQDRGPGTGKQREFPSKVTPS